MLRRSCRIPSPSGRQSTCSPYFRRRSHALHTSVLTFRDESQSKRPDRRRYRPLDHSPYIDPSSLKQSLENVREANRAGLIRKVYQDGRSKAINHPHPVTFPASQEDADYTPLQEAFTLSRSVPLSTSLSEYAGSPQSLKNEWRLNESISLHLSQPWFNYIRPPTKALTVAEALSSEIEAFGKYMTPTEKEELAADRAIADIQNAVSSINSELELEVIGSRSSGLAMPLSDLDFNVVTNEGRLDDVMDRDRATANLRKLRVRLNRNRKLGNLILVKRAKIPIIRGIHRSTGLEFQIQHTTNAYNSTEYVKMFLKEYPMLRDLFLVLRQLLIMRGISDGSKQGLTSYPLINMILISLKFDEQNSRPADLGSQLLSFLEMYSKMDFDSDGLSVTPPKLLPKVRAGDESSRSQRESADEVDWAAPNPGFAYAMYLRDPADPSNDLGRSCALIRVVQATFLEAARALAEGMAEWSLEEKGQQPKPLLRFLEGDYRTLEVDRSSLRRPLPQALAPEAEDAMAEKLEMISTSD